MKLLVLFVWLIVPLGIWGAVTIWGAPHLALSYTFYDNGRRYDPMAPRTFITCTWYGLGSTVTLPAKSGQCP